MALSATPIGPILLGVIKWFQALRLLLALKSLHWAFYCSSAGLLSKGLKMKIKKYVNHKIKKTQISGYTITEDSGNTAHDVTYRVMGNQNTTDKALRAVRRFDPMFTTVNDPIVYDENLVLPTKMFDAIALPEARADVKSERDIALKIITKLVNLYDIKASELKELTDGID